MTSLPVSQILDFLTAQQIEFTYRGALDQVISGFSSLNHYQAGTITWVRSQEKAATCCLEGEIALIVVQNGVAFPSKNQIITDEAKLAFFSIAERFFSEPDQQYSEFANTAYLGPLVHLGEGVTIGPHTVLDGNIEIGSGTQIGPNVTIMGHVTIGENCVIQAGCVIGLDGYAFAERQDGRRYMIKHHGGVVIEDNVWIGANTNIARGTIDNTIIRKNAKIDALIHIAHNVEIGENAAIVAHSTVMGSVQVGRDAYISTSIVRDQAHLGKGCFVAMGAVVTQDIPERTMVVGLPARVVKHLEER